MRRLLAIFLLFFTLFQAAATSAQGMVFDRGLDQELAHTVMHWEGTAHHHDDQGDYHQDDSDESAQHILADTALGVPALLQALPLLFPAERMPSPVAMTETARPPPFLGGLIRPPRLTV
jgi:hypothetical protein